MDIQIPEKRVQRCTSRSTAISFRVTHGDSLHRRSRLLDYCIHHARYASNFPRAPSTTKYSRTICQFPNLQTGNLPVCPVPPTFLTTLSASEYRSPRVLDATGGESESPSTTTRIPFHEAWEISEIRSIAATHTCTYDLIDDQYTLEYHLEPTASRTPNLFNHSRDGIASKSPCTHP